MNPLSIIAIVLMTVFATGISYSEENIYTWKDENGVLNITDQRPPSNAEIIDISPSHRLKTMELLRQRQIRQLEIEKRDLEELRKQKEIKALKEKEAARKTQEQGLLEQKAKSKNKERKKKKGY